MREVWLGTVFDELHIQTSGLETAFRLGIGIGIDIMYASRAPRGGYTRLSRIVLKRLGALDEADSLAWTDGKTLGMSRTNWRADICYAANERREGILAPFAW